MAKAISDETTRTMRGLWFDYLDTVEPIRARLHAYCLRLSGSVWEAEDLVQEALLRGFGAMGRGDLHGAHSAFSNPRAYFCHIATNLWIDRMRRRRWEGPPPGDADGPSAEQGAVLTPAAGAALFERTAPQERAAIVLKDVFDFSLEDIADILATTPGAVKSALHRGRGKLAQAQDVMPARSAAASAELVGRFIAAFNARDMAAMVALLMDSTTYEPLGVGGERGRKTIWLSVFTPDIVVAEPHVLDGSSFVAFTFVAGGAKYLGGIERLEEADGRIARIINYYFCPDTIAHVAGALGLAPWSNGYHQDPETLTRMIADTRLPWRGQ